MRNRQVPCVVTLLIAVLGWVCPVQAQMLAPGLWDAPSSFFPGKYFEHKAQFYLKGKYYDAAVQMFELSGYWGDKLSQYNAGVMYFNGIGIPVDEVRGVAWLRIAAESHGDLAESTLQTATARLTDAQRQQADALWLQLDAKYGNGVTLPRAIARYHSDGFDSMNHGMPGGNLQVYEANTAGDGLAIGGSDYMKEKEARLAQLINEIGGTITVGTVRTLAVPEDARQNTPAKSDRPAASAPVPLQH